MEKRPYGIFIVFFSKSTFDRIQAFWKKAEPEAEHTILNDILAELSVFLIQNRYVFSNDPDHFQLLKSLNHLLRIKSGLAGNFMYQTTAAANGVKNGKVQRDIPELLTKHVLRLFIEVTCRIEILLSQIFIQRLLRIEHGEILRYASCNSINDRLILRRILWNKPRRCQIVEWLQIHLARSPSVKRRFSPENFFFHERNGRTAENQHDIHAAPVMINNSLKH